MTRKLFSVMLAFLMIFAAERALAGNIGIGARYALVHMQQADDNTGMAGAFVRLGHGLLGLEGTIDYRSKDVGSGTTVKTWPVTASLLVRPLPIVFAGAGVGWYNTTVDFADDVLGNQTESTLGYQFGAGVQLPITPMVSLVGDARYHFVDYDFKDIPSNFDLNDADYYSLHGGLMVWLP